MPLPGPITEASHPDPVRSTARIPALYEHKFDCIASRMTNTLVRGLLLPQASRIRPRDIAAVIPRLLDLVVPGADDFFRCIAPENWPCTSRMLPLGVRIPVLAGAATVSGHPENWIGKLTSAAAPPHRANLRNCLEALAHSDDAQPPDSTSPDSGYCGNIRNPARGNSDNKWQQPRERALFR